MTVIAALAAFVLLQIQQPPRDVRPDTSPPATQISGVVTVADTGAPIRGAEIVLSGASLPGRRPLGTVTDGDGRYEVGPVPAGTYTVTASKPGYVRLAYGQTRSDQQGRSIQVTSEPVDNINIALPRGAVIVVRLADTYGDPAPGFRVIAYQPRFVDGQRRLTPLSSESLYVTDDRGEIRLSGLAPGEYYVGALPGGVPGSTLMNPRGKDPQTFYPGTASELDAQPVVVGLGEEVPVAIQLLSGSRLARISGVITGDERPALRMMRRILGSTSSLPISAAPDGTFTVSNLPPGEYTITAQGAKESGVLRVTVGSEDIDGLVLTMGPALTLRGRITFDGGKPPGGRWPDFRITVPDDSGFTRLALVRSDWTFQADGVVGSGVIRLQQPPRDWFLRAVLVNGKDVTDSPMDYKAFDRQPIEIVLTQRVAEVTGTVMDARERPAADYVVIVFPEDRLQWTLHNRFILAARPDQQGRFSVRGLAAGRYLVRAVEYLPPGQEREPATLERLRAGAIALALTEGQSQDLSLRLLP